MTGLTIYTPHYSACIGAFARYLLPRWPTLKLDVFYEPGVDHDQCTRTMAMLNLPTGTVVNVTVEIPGRGENTKMVWDAQSRGWVRSTEPLAERLQTLILTREVERPMLLDKHAQIALVRTQRAVAGEYQPLGVGELRAAERYGDYKQLPPGPTNSIEPISEVLRLSDVKIYINGKRVD